MKKIVCTLAIAAGLIHAAAAQDKKQETIEGNGKLETRNVAVNSFCGRWSVVGGRSEIVFLNSNKAYYESKY